MKLRRIGWIGLGAWTVVWPGTCSRPALRWPRASIPNQHDNTTALKVLAA